MLNILAKVKLLIKYAAVKNTYGYSKMLSGRISGWQFINISELSERENEV